MRFNYIHNRHVVLHHQQEQTQGSYHPGQAISPQPPVTVLMGEGGAILDSLLTMVHVAQSQVEERWEDVKDECASN